MLSLPLPLTPTRIDLDPPFAVLPTGLRAAVLLSLVAGAAAVLARLYRPELGRVSARAARVLLALRMTAVAVVAAVLLASPVVVRRTGESAPGRVLVAVDLSDSMRVSDPGRPLVGKLRLARALQLHDGVTTDEQLAAWLADAEESGSPQFPPPDTDAGVARRAMFEEVVSRADALTRLQAAGRALTPAGADLLGLLRKGHTVDVVGFGQTLTEVAGDPDAIAARSPSTAFTDLNPPLRRALVRHGEQPLLGVVVFTDGRHNWGEPPAALARSLAARGVPVFPVNVAPREPPPDVAVLSVTPAVSTVCRGGPLPVSVRVGVTRRPAERIEVGLRSSDGRPPLTHALQHDGTDRTYEVTFRPRFERAGPVTLTAEAKPERPDRIPDNNTRTAALRIVEHRPRVLLIGSGPLENLSASQDPGLDLQFGPFPDDEGTLAGFDCVVLGDTEPGQLSPKDREHLERYVADGGRTLVVVAGKLLTPAAGPDTDPLWRLLPVRNQREFAPEGGFAPEVTPEGRRVWFLRLGETPEQDRAAWDSLPPLESAVVGEARDGAEVLATAPAPEGRGAALVVRQSCGFGRVLFVGSGDIGKPGGERHDRFWAQVLQGAAAGRPLPARNAAGTVRFGIRGSASPGSQPVECLLRATQVVPALTPAAAKGVRLIRLSEQPGKTETLVRIVPLEQSGGRPRELTARVADLPPGRYAAEPDVPEWADHLRGSPGRLRATFEVATPADEVTQLSANLPLLGELASTTGGRVFDISEVNDLPDVLAARAVREAETSTPLRRSWWTLAVVALLLAAEWAARRLAGLP